MMINTQTLVPMTDANQNFSKVVKLVDEQGAVVILKNNKPRYVVVDFKEYNEIQAMRASLLQKAGDRIISENIEAFKVLAK